MVICFDEVATIFGMELAIIGKTKVVCNHFFSKSMELEARKGDAATEEEPQHDTRGSRTLLELLQNDSSFSGTYNQGTRGDN